MFQFTRPRGARHGRTPIIGQVGQVSIHAPTRGATSIFARIFALTEFQFTRPRGARLYADSMDEVFYRFNSRAHEGRDILTSAGVSALSAFQFTRPRGARRKCAACQIRKRKVSIHAPTRGATSEMAASVGVKQQFQFTRPRGARRRSPRTTSCATCFNSRAHEGRDSSSAS